MLRLKTIHIENKPTSLQCPLVGYNPISKELAWQEGKRQIAQVKNLGQTDLNEETILKWDASSFSSTTTSIKSLEKGIQVREGGLFKSSIHFFQKSKSQRVKVGIQFTINEVPGSFKTLSNLVEVGQNDYQNTLSLTQLLPLKTGDIVNIKTISLGNAGMVETLKHSCLLILEKIA